MSHRTSIDFRIHFDGTARFDVHLRDGWQVEYELAIEAGRVVVRGLTVSAAGKPPAGGLTAGFLRDELVLGSHIYELLPEHLELVHRADVVRQGDGVVFVDHAHAAAFLTALGFTKGAARPGRRGPKGWPLAEYAQLASEYLARCETGSRSPVADLAAEHRTTEAAMRAALNRARRRGLLSRKRPGSAGGVLTPMAKRLLKLSRAEGRKR